MTSDQLVLIAEVLDRYFPDHTSGERVGAAGEIAGLLASAGLCWDEGGIEWPGGQRPRCELRAGHLGAHECGRGSMGGTAVWTHLDAVSDATQPTEQMAPLDDPRVEPDSYVVYPTDYDLIPFSDKDSWALTVVNGHAYGWSIRPGIGMKGPVALNRRGKHIFESRGSGHNKARRWPLDEALRIALRIVDSHKHAGMSAAEAIANREHILAERERRSRPGGEDRG